MSENNNTNRLIVSTILFFMLATLPLWLFLMFKCAPGHHTGTGDDGSPWFLCAESNAYLLLTIFATLSAAATFGSLGSLFSLISRNKNIDLTQNEYLLILFYGALAAIILSLIFAGGLIAGSLFPGGDSQEIGWFGIIYTFSEFAKLLVWSFVIGFSERVMPEIILSLSKRLKVSDSSKRHDMGADEKDP